jgi:hypothetical protein
VPEHGVVCTATAQAGEGGDVPGRHSDEGYALVEAHCARLRDDAQLTHVDLQGLAQVGSLGVAARWRLAGLAGLGWLGCLGCLGCLGWLG